MFADQKDMHAARKYDEDDTILWLAYIYMRCNASPDTIMIKFDSALSIATGEMYQHSERGFNYYCCCEAHCK